MPREGTANLAAQALILTYRVTISPFLYLCGIRCRHEPSCSAYGLEAYRRHPPIRATGLTAKRVLSCRPGGTWGYDPVPARAEKPSATGERC